MAPPSLTPASLHMLAAYPRLTLILVGDSAILESISQILYDKSRLLFDIRNKSKWMNRRRALRTKKDSSMRIAINLVKEEQRKLA